MSVTDVKKKWVKFIKTVRGYDSGKTYVFMDISDPEELRMKMNDWAESMPGGSESGWSARAEEEIPTEDWLNDEIKRKRNRIDYLLDELEELEEAQKELY